MTKFIVPGPPKGFTAAARRAVKVNLRDRERVEEFNAYCAKVRIFAMQAGLIIPLQADRQHVVDFRVWCYYRDGRGPDPLNVLKGIQDALFYTKAGDKGDKWTSGWHSIPLFDSANPRVEVEIEECTYEYWLETVLYVDRKSPEN